MQCKSVCNLPTTAEIQDADGILITQGGQTTRMLMSAFREYILVAKGADGVGIAKIEQTTVSAEDDGNNIFTVTMTNGDTYTLTVQNGSKGGKGDKGDPGVGIKKVAQTSNSTADNGDNVITVTLTDDSTFTFTVQNGSKGSDAKINGLNAITIQAGSGVKLTQNGSVFTVELDISSESLTYHYEDGSTRTVEVYVK